MVFEYLYNLLFRKTEKHFYYLSLVKEKKGEFTIHGLCPNLNLQGCKIFKSNI